MATIGRKRDAIGPPSDDSDDWAKSGDVETVATVLNEDQHDDQIANDDNDRCCSARGLKMKASRNNATASPIVDKDLVEFLGTVLGEKEDEDETAQTGRGSTSPSAFFDCSPRATHNGHGVDHNGSVHGHEVKDGNNDSQSKPWNGGAATGGGTLSSPARSSSHVAVTADLWSPPPNDLLSAALVHTPPPFTNPTQDLLQGVMLPSPSVASRLDSFIESGGSSITSYETDMDDTDLVLLVPADATVFVDDENDRNHNGSFFTPVKMSTDLIAATSTKGDKIGSDSRGKGFSVMARRAIRPSPLTTR